MPPLPNRGEIWLADLNPTRGHEQGGETDDEIYEGATHHRYREFMRAVFRLDECGGNNPEAAMKNISLLPPNRQEKLHLRSLSPLRAIER